MTEQPPAARIGLFADGPVGEAVLSILAERCPECLAYVVVHSRDGPVTGGHERCAPDVPLLCWTESAEVQSLPRYGDDVPDVVLLAWWPHILRRPFLAAGQQATLNMHPSLLPHGRGKDPNFWALADGEPFGVTIHHVDEGVDTGAIAFQAALPVGWEDTGATLYTRAQAALVELFAASLDAILSLTIPKKPHAPRSGSRHRRAELDPRSLIDLDAVSTHRDLLNLLRARTFPPHPGCRFTDGTATYQIRVQVERIED